MKQKICSRRTGILSCIVLVFCIITAYLWFAWWIPHQKMRDVEWYQTASQEEIRKVCHQVLRFPVGNHHDAFLSLAIVGNAESVPLLIRSLRWQSPPDESGFTVCTTEHVVEALESLTGEEFGFDRERWQGWWNESGSKLPSSSFYSRKTRPDLDHPEPGI